MADLYVNSSASASGGLPGGSDSNAGTIAAPFLTIGKALETFKDSAADPEWVADEVIIHLANGSGQPPYAAENVPGSNPVVSTNKIDLTSLLYKYGGRLTIQAYDLPENFFLPYPPDIGEVHHTAWTYPLPVLPPIEFGGRSGEVELRGLSMTGGGGSIFGTQPFFGIRGMSGHSTIVSCRLSGNKYGLFTVDSICTAVGCLFDQNDVGIFALHNSVVLLPALNAITNSKEIGLCAAVNSTVAVPTMAGPGEPTPEELAVLEIRTSEARKDYTAVKAMTHSRILLDGEIPGLGTNAPIPGLIRIVRGSGYDHENYRGVVLESMSLLMGGRNVQFRVPTKQFAGISLNFGSTSTDLSSDDSAAELDTIPPERQFVVASEQGAVVID